MRTIGNSCKKIVRITSIMLLIAAALRPTLHYTPVYVELVVVAAFLIELRLQTRQGNEVIEFVTPRLLRVFGVRIKVELT